MTEKIPTKIAGIRTVVILKALPRTCSRYSRFAISQMLCIGASSNRLNEDLFERWLDQFEFVDARLADRLAQQRLRIGMVFQFHFRVAGVVFELGNRLVVQK